MTDAQKEIIDLLGDIKAAQGGGGAASFASLTGNPSDNPALGSALDAKGPVPNNDAYNAVAWEADETGSATRKAIRDKIEAVVASIPPTHSGGVIGTASFTASGSIGTLVFDGIISGVIYDSVGRYDVAFTVSQPNTNYVVGPVAESPVENRVFNVSVKTVDGFRLYCLNAGDGSQADTTGVAFTISRLSQ